MNVSTAHKIQKKEKPNDVFYTPIDLVKTHLEIIKPYVKEKDLILDPFFGSGNYFNLFKEYFTKSNTYDFTEIELKKDFFKYNKEVNIIISNPPYSCINEVLEHSVKLKPRIISYLIGIINLTPKRIEYMNNKGYILKNLYITKVYKWFSTTAICTFILKTEDDEKNCISYDRVIYK
jgi:hypothetical protein